jgi:hypothetical protein
MLTFSVGNRFCVVIDGGRVTHGSHPKLVSQAPGESD